MPRTEGAYRPRVLLLEDESLIGLDLALTLQSEGFEVLGPCRSLEEAKAAMGKFYPDVAVLDINLGGDNNSFKFASELRENQCECLFLTSYTEDVLPTPKDLGSIRRLSKPISPGAISSEVRKLVES